MKGFLRSDDIEARRGGTNALQSLSRHMEAAERQNQHWWTNILRSVIIRDVPKRKTMVFTERLPVG